MKKIILKSITGFVWVCMVISAHTQSITKAEYFFDTDPGLTLGTSIAVPVAGDQVDITAHIPVNGLNSGFHNLFIRTRNANGIWGLYETRSFYIKPVVSSLSFQLKQAEYFFDTDPGFGQGTAITAFTMADQISLTRDIATSGLSSGFHNFFIRIKSDDGHWSLYEGRNFYIKPVISSSDYQLVKGEYFFDTDPGIGKATVCNAFTSGTDISLSQNISVNSLSLGFHKLFVRIFGDNGKWSLYEARNFYIKPARNYDDSIKITSAEYFFDTDPGKGLATQFPAFAPADSINKTQSISLTGLNTGTHKLYIRAQNTLGVYSLAEYRSFNIIVTGMDNPVLPGLKIYPIPSNGNFTIELVNPFHDDILVTMVDQMGETMYRNNLKKQHTAKLEVNLQNIIPPGVYYIRFHTNSKIIVQKIVIF
jgi:hypothetical protein